VPTQQPTVDRSVVGRWAVACKKAKEEDKQVGGG